MRLAAVSSLSLVQVVQHHQLVEAQTVSIFSNSWILFALGVTCNLAI